jgi:hypothetical protein
MTGLSKDEREMFLAGVSAEPNAPIRPIINGREAQFNHVMKIVLDALLPLTKDERSRGLEVIRQTYCIWPTPGGR